MQKKIGIVIEARCKSTRLPYKVLLPLHKKTILEFLVNRLKKISKKINSKIIIATTKNKEDIKIIQLAKKNKISYYAGSENNVLKRVVEAADKHNIGTIIRITSDCPIVDTQIIEQLFRIFVNNEVDLVTNAHVRSYPDGMDVEIVSIQALTKALKLARKNKELLEHVTLTLKKYKKKFKIINLISPEETRYPSLGLTLDETSDYELIKKITGHFKSKKNLSFGCIDIINLLKKKPKLLKINSMVKRTKYSV